MCEISVQIMKLWNKQTTKGKDCVMTEPEGRDKPHMMDHRNLAVCVAMGVRQPQ